MSDSIWKQSGWNSLVSSYFFFILWWKENILSGMRERERERQKAFFLPLSPYCYIGLDQSLMSLLKSERKWKIKGERERERERERDSEIDKLIYILSVL